MRIGKCSEPREQEFAPTAIMAAGAFFVGGKWAGSMVGWMYRINRYLMRNTMRHHLSYLIK